MNWAYHFRLARTERETTEMWFYICDLAANRFNNWFNVYDRYNLRDDFYISRFIFSHEVLVKGRSPLDLALLFGHDAIARQLLKKMDKVDYSQHLIPAARAGSVSIIRVLLEAGVSIEVRNSRDYISLMEAACVGEHLAV